MATGREIRNLSRMNVRMYEAANQDRMTASWDTNPWTIDQIIYSQLERLRSRSREQARNNTHIGRLINVLQTNIIGAVGFLVKSMVIDSKGEADKLARKIITGGWTLWEEDVDLLAMEHIIMASLVTDGEAFLLLERDKGRRLIPRLIDPALIDINYNRNETGLNVIKFGIEYDSLKRPIKFHINDDPAMNHPIAGNTGQGNVKRTPIDAANMIHIFRKMCVGQTRGIPWASIALGDLFQLGRYKTAAVTAARIGAAKMGFFTNEEDEEYEGDEESGNFTVNAEAGTFENIGNKSFEAFDPTYPAGEFKVFLGAALQAISGGLGIDAHTFSNDYSQVNYSSARVGMLETREYYKTLQTWLTRCLMRPLFDGWLGRELMMGRLSVGNAILNRGLAYYRPARFQGRRWDWVDPLKEITAKEKAYFLRITSLSQIIRERGDEPEEVFKEIAEEKEQLELLGIAPENVMSKIKKEEKDDAKD